MKYFENSGGTILNPLTTSTWIINWAHDGCWKCWQELMKTKDWHLLMILWTTVIETNKFCPISSVDKIWILGGNLAIDKHHSINLLKSFSALCNYKLRLGLYINSIFNFLLFFTADVYMLYDVWRNSGCAIHNGLL